MNGKGLKIFRILSIVAIITVTVALEAARANSITLPDQAIRLLGILDIAAISILILSSVKMFFDNRKEK